MAEPTADELADLVLWGIPGTQGKGTVPAMISGPGGTLVAAPYHRPTEPQRRRCFAALERLKLMVADLDAERLVQTYRADEHLRAWVESAPDIKLAAKLVALEGALAEIGIVMSHSSIREHDLADTVLSIIDRSLRASHV